MNKIEKIAEAIFALSFIEILQLFQLLHDKYHVKIPRVLDQIKTECFYSIEMKENTPEENPHNNVTLILDGYTGCSKFSVIKEIKELCGLSLRYAKDLVDNTPCNILINAPLKECQKKSLKINEVGGITKIVKSGESIVKYSSRGGDVTIIKGYE